MTSGLFFFVCCAAIEDPHFRAGNVLATPSVQEGSGNTLATPSAAQALHGPEEELRMASSALLGSGNTLATPSAAQALHGPEEELRMAVEDLDPHFRANKVLATPAARRRPPAPSGATDVGAQMSLKQDRVTTSGGKGEGKGKGKGKGGGPPAMTSDSVANASDYNLTAGHPGGLTPREFHPSRMLQMYGGLITNFHEGPGPTVTQLTTWHAIPAAPAARGSGGGGRGPWMCDPCVHDASQGNINELAKDVFGAQADPVKWWVSLVPGDMMLVPHDDDAGRIRAPEKWMSPRVHYETWRTNDGNALGAHYKRNAGVEHKSQLSVAYKGAIMQSVHTGRGYDERGAENMGTDENEKFICMNYELKDCSEGQCIEGECPLKKRKLGEYKFSVVGRVHGSRINSKPPEGTRAQTPDTHPERYAFAKKDIANYRKMVYRTYIDVGALGDGWKAFAEGGSLTAPKDITTLTTDDDLSDSGLVFFGGDRSNPDDTGLKLNFTKIYTSGTFAEVDGDVTYTPKSTDKIKVTMQPAKCGVRPTRTATDGNGHESQAAPVMTKIVDGFWADAPEDCPSWYTAVVEGDEGKRWAVQANDHGYYKHVGFDFHLHDFMSEEFKKNDEFVKLEKDKQFLCEAGTCFIMNFEFDLGPPEQRTILGSPENSEPNEGQVGTYFAYDPEISYAHFAFPAFALLLGMW